MTTLKEMENKLITIALAKVDGNRRKAAELLGIPVRKLQRRIAERVKNDK